MRYLVLLFVTAGLIADLAAHHPDHKNRPVHLPVDVIGPLGNRLPMSYRRRYNRPTYFGGKIAYHIAPSSQEAMRWHEAQHRGYYQCEPPRTVDHYFYSKPWEMIPIGPRPAEEGSDDER